MSFAVSRTAEATSRIAPASSGIAPLWRMALVVSFMITEYCLIF